MGKLLEFKLSTFNFPLSTLTSSTPFHFGKESKLSLRSTFRAPHFQLPTSTNLSGYLAMSFLYSRRTFSRSAS